MAFKKSLMLGLMFILSSCGVKPVLANETIAECRSGYPELGSSEYVLPYMPQAEYVVGQGNCTNGSHELNTDQAYAYDFDLPIGTQIVASRTGVVTVVVEHYSENNNMPGQENYIVIEHNDESISAYYHLTKEGAYVSVGDLVYQGGLIALSGNTGDSSEPHLHFEVARCEDCETYPINFNNTRQHTSGLIEGEFYRAQ